MSAWTPEKVEQLKALMDEGLSFRQIGEAIGMGRCSCIGKAHRLGLRRGEEAKHPPGPRKPRPYRAKPTPPPAPVTVTAPPLSAGPVLIGELESHHCRFIVCGCDTETIRYCGAPALIASSWCADHQKICFQGRSA